MNLIKLSTFLKDRLQQLENRKISIQFYLKDKKKFLGKTQYKPEDMIITDDRINETKAALAGIEAWRKGLLKIE